MVGQPARFQKEKAANLMARHNQQIDASNFVYYSFDKQRPSFENSHPKMGADAVKPLKYGKTEIQFLFEPLQFICSSMELSENLRIKNCRTP